MGDFLKTLIPWANWWNGVILTFDVVVLVCYIIIYRKTKVRNLLTSMPGLFTSLGILGTFGAICQSLAGISVEPMTVNNVGKTIGEAATSAAGSLDLKQIIADLIPAFSTSIYGLVFAFFSTFFTRLHFAKEDTAFEQTLKYKNPEEAIEALDAHVLRLTEANETNNNKLTDTIKAQSEILSKFVDSFVEKMESTFTAMNQVIEERVSNFGTTQYTQSREILEGITRQLGDDARSLIQSHKDSVTEMTQASTNDLAAIKTALTDAVNELKTNTVSGIEGIAHEQTAALQKITEDSLNNQMRTIEAQNDFNSELLSRMSSSLENTTARIIESVGAQIAVLQTALQENVQRLNESYDFISEKSSSIVSNYEQATEAYQDAVQNAHDLNEQVVKGLDKVGDSLKSVGKTNEGVDQILELIKDKETNMEAIVMRIEELGSAIVTLQKLESVLSKIANK